MAIPLPGDIGSGGRNTRDEESDPDPTRDVRDSYRGSSPIGSGGVEFGVDDRGRARQRIGDGGERAVGDDEYTSVGYLPTQFVDSPLLRRTEQYLEDATGGRAFGDPNQWERISGATAFTVPDAMTFSDVRETVRNARGGRSWLLVAATLIGAFASALTLLREVGD
jgi:hypothetical protein